MLKIKLKKDENLNALKVLANETGNTSANYSMINWKERHTLKIAAQNVFPANESLIISGSGPPTNRSNV